MRAELPADLVFANHVLLGGPVGAASGARFAVKAHGSELEYAMRGNAELQAWGRESLAARRGGLRRLRSTSAGCSRRSSATSSTSTRSRPGSTSTSSAPQPRAEALAALLEEARRDPPNDGNERLPDDGNAERLAEFLADDEPTVVYFGKLLYNKGVHLLLEALRELDARAVIVGFGDYREELERLAPPRTLFTGPLEHRHLVHLLPLADVTVVPSIFPEAFGMVAAEAAAAGSPPLVARHSGLRGDRRRARGRVPARVPPPDELRDRRRRRPDRQARASCSRSHRKSTSASRRPVAGPSSTAGAGRASPTGCFNPSKAPTRRRRPRAQVGFAQLSV